MPSTISASTFTWWVIASTNSDPHSAVCGGIGIKGNLHGERGRDGHAQGIMADTEGGG